MSINLNILTIKLTVVYSFVEFPEFNYLYFLSIQLLFIIYRDIYDYEIKECK